MSGVIQGINDCLAGDFIETYGELIETPSGIYNQAVTMHLISVVLSRLHIFYPK